MLVLTRKQNEKIRIGDDITITVVRTKGKSVRLGIQAPSDLRVLRGEIVFDVEPERATDETSVVKKSGDAASEVRNCTDLRRQAAVRSDIQCSDDWPLERTARREDRETAGQLCDRTSAVGFGPLHTMVHERAM